MGTHDSSQRQRGAGRKRAALKAKIAVPDVAAKRAPPAWRFIGVPNARAAHGPRKDKRV
jgi:hypothetical protein